jgi:hypothetical protein
VRCVVLPRGCGVSYFYKNRGEECPKCWSIKIAINTLNSDSITPEKQALGHFTRCKLKKLTTWNDWEAGKHKQLDQFYGQKMFGDAIDPMLLPKQVVVLRTYWNYIVK